MLVVYSQQDGLTRGVTRTFDGKNPCSLCKSISRATAEERASQHSKQKATPTESVWAAIVTENRFDPRVFQCQLLIVLPLFFNNLIHSPLTPPPRA